MLMFLSEKKQVEDAPSSPPCKIITTPPVKSTEKLALRRPPQPIPSSSQIGTTPQLTIFVALVTQ